MLQVAMGSQWLNKIAQHAVIGFDLMWVGPALDQPGHLENGGVHHMGDVGQALSCCAASLLILQVQVDVLMVSAI